MMYTTGIVYSLKEVGEKFIEFAQQSNANTQAWELLDDRLSSFYGATLKVPLLDWKEESIGEACYYISLEHMDIVKEGKNSTYASWLRTGENTRENVPKAHRDEHQGPLTGIYYQSEKYNHTKIIEDGSRAAITKFGDTNLENIFKNTGEFIAVGLHTLYDDRLWMCEQGQITCTKEATEQINDLNLMPAMVFEYHEGTIWPTLKFDSLPVFPGTGCPWFTLSDDNKEEYGVEQNGIKYWFTKGNHDATITIMIQNQGEKPDCYQSMSFGKLATADKLSHVYPLYVAGGNQGLSQDTLVYTLLGENQRPTNTGSNNVYDLNMRNICLSNSNLLTPTKFNGANMSNFRVLTAEGTWRDIFGYEQSAKIEAMFTCADYPSDFVALLGEPKDMEEEHNGAFHCLGDSWNRMDIYTINKLFNGYDHSSTLERVFVFMNNLCDNGENGIQGYIPNVYANWFRELPIGEIIINNKKYLSVPNGWETRLWYYESSTRPPTKKDLDNDTLSKEVDDLLKAGNNKKMSHRLLIPLEDGA